MALIKCQHHWLNWRDKGTDFVKVLSFDFSKAFDSVSHKIVCDKLKFYDFNPYITNWIISFLISDPKARVVVDGVTTKYVDINGGVPQGTALGLVLFSVMVNGITAANPTSNLLVKYADDITHNVPVISGAVDQSQAEVNNIQRWATENQMTLNLNKT